MGEGGHPGEHIVDVLIAERAPNPHAAQVTEALKLYIERVVPDDPDRPFA